MRAQARGPRRKFPTHIIVFLAPAFLIYTVFMVYPLFDSLRLSLFAPDPENPQEETFVGFQNYKTLLTSEFSGPRVQGALQNNVRFFAIHMLVQNPIALLLATLLAGVARRAGAIYRTLIFTPTVLSFVLVGFVWSIILNPLWGIADDVLGLVGLDAAPWMGLPESALNTLGLISVWQFVGIPMMLFLVAIIGIPEEVVEAARVDGATSWGVFWRIKFPLILPTVGVVSVLTFVGNFNAFDLVYTMQGALAGPNFSTDLLGTLFYRTFFGFQLTPPSPTMGAAVAGIMFMIILTGVVVYLVGIQLRLRQYEF